MPGRLAEKVAPLIAGGQRNWRSLYARVRGQWRSVNAAVSAVTKAVRSPAKLLTLMVKPVTGILIDEVLLHGYLARLRAIANRTGFCTPTK
jgi:hypothetical protein